VKFWSSILTGISELLAHKLRSLLTMLGVIFGIASVIAMVSIGAGARQEALEQIRLMGINVIQINRRALSGDLALEAERQSPQGVTYGDAKAIGELYEAAERVVPVCRVFGEVRHNGTAIPAKVLGTTPDYSRVNRLALASGRFVDDGDIERHAQVCVIGSEVKRAAFFLEDAVGKNLRIGTQEFQVIGVLEERRVQAGSSLLSLPDVRSTSSRPSRSISPGSSSCSRSCSIVPRWIRGRLHRSLCRCQMNRKHGRQLGWRRGSSSAGTKRFPITRSSYQRNCSDRANGPTGSSAS
jgi:hypothetical protein